MLSVNDQWVYIVKGPDKVGIGSFLRRKERQVLDPIYTEFEYAVKTLMQQHPEWLLGDKKVFWILVVTYLMDADGSGAMTI